MPRDGAVIFRHLVSKLDVFNIECDKCDRRVAITSIDGIDAKLFDPSDDITVDCRGSKRGLE